MTTKATKLLNRIQIEERLKYAMDKGEWKTGLFDCLGDPVELLKAWCCPCVVYGQVAATLNGNPKAWTEDCCLYCLCCHFTTCIGGALRTDIRKKFGITQNDPNGEYWDCIVHASCGPCALVQEARQLKPDRAVAPSS
ncbi:hypothetical protein HDV03_002872 [Kappamyces sp. JEL0829]|nr:hypothetical protein HDV03_002872 [Kappamyces sp. JEL0829]KAJ3333565.1 hypothetical protein HDU91_002894 [Kappamyces sp. JEL0680]